VVFELSGPAEWSVRSMADGSLAVSIPKASLDESVRDLSFGHGLLRGIRSARLAGGVEIRLETNPAHRPYRTLTLENPDRLVVDLPAGAEKTAEGGRRAPQATVQESRKSSAAPSTSPSIGLRPAVPDRMETGRPAPGPAVVAAPPPPRAIAAQAERDGPEEGLAATARPSLPVPPPADSGGREVIGGPPEGGNGSTTGRRPGGPREAAAATLTVVLDPGHGGHDTGAIGPTGLTEKEVVLDLGLRLRRLLEQRLKVRVLMTRTEDVFVPLPERAAMANRAKADFFISLHVNGSQTRGVVGVETFFFAREPSDNDARASSQRENLVLDTSGTAGKDQESLLKITLTDMAVTRDIKESSNLAELMLGSLDRLLKVENRGVKSGPFYVLATAAMPAVLVESAFITNPREERRLQREEHRQRIAEALFDGVAKYKARYEQRVGMHRAPLGGVGS
jgi:N-acetylmuramoyl-L-alanine amidase